MEVKVGKWYHITPKSKYFLLSEGDYLVVAIRGLSRSSPQFGVEGDLSYHDVSLFDFVPILSACSLFKGPVVGIPEEVSAGEPELSEPKLSLYGKDIAELCQFSKASGFTLAETLIFFLGERLFGYPAISDKTRNLYKDLKREKLLQENSTDRVDIRIYNISTGLLEMLVTESLQGDLILVPEITGGDAKIEVLRL